MKLMTLLGKQLIVLFFVLFSPIALAVILPQEVILNTQGAFPPYAFYDEQRKLNGISVISVRCISERMGIPFKLRVHSWKRSQKMVKEGDGDGFFPASRNQHRDQYAIQSGIISYQIWTWYLPKNSLIAPNSAEFKQTGRVGGRFGSNHLTWLEDEQFNVTFTPKTWIQLIKGLKAGRMDAFVATEATLDPLLASLNNRYNFRKVALEGVSKPHGIYFRKTFLAQYPDFLAAFNQYTEACREFAEVEFFGK